MATTQVLVLFASAFLSMLFAGVASTRSNETWHEHAVENPEEVAAMVDIIVIDQHLVTSGWIDSCDLL
ncbi:unnamed protein product [Eruca vesicaria subsp. sativa]|uniref:Uncharacterized protein n=1 Tax=Eruca vesicaria subsp. sativa TaxID=29727 RepID=A0ABC8KC16_ERUVS|nr:unnamed protein product [Eruca vesicaria subsp. sativa]